MTASFVTDARDGVFVFSVGGGNLEKNAPARVAPGSGAARNEVGIARTNRKCRMIVWRDSQ